MGEIDNDQADETAGRAFRASREATPTYKIIRATDIADLATAVNENILNGWTPLGGPAYCPPGMQEATHLPHPFWQAMIWDASD